MAKRKMTEKLVSINSIKEELVLINGSDTDYITPSGKIYKLYENNMFYPKRNFINKYNGYLYCGITYKNKQKQRRVHILVAEAFMPNPNDFTVVGHLNNDKSDPQVSNLYWTTTSENTKKAYEDNLANNKKSWEDSQSIPVCCFDMNKNKLYDFGSVKEASKQTNVTATAILNQCNHNVKTKPRCNYYFRYYTEYNEKGFVL